MIDPLVFKNDWVRAGFFGKVTSKEIIDINNELMEHPQFKTNRKSLWRFHDIEDIVISTNEIRMLAEDDRVKSEENPDRRLAIVSDSSLVFGLCRMYEAFYRGGPWKVEVFYDLEEAEEWLSKK